MPPSILPHRHYKQQIKPKVYDPKATPSLQPPLIMSIAHAFKVGPWGGNGGTVFDVTAPPTRLDNMTIRAGEFIDSIGFSYVDDVGTIRIAGPFGGTGGNLTTIRFAATEFVTKLSGTLYIRSASAGGKPVLSSLEIVTNTNRYGPYGTVHQDYLFSFPLPWGLIITGFFGRAGSIVDAIGVYIGYKIGGERLDAITVATDEETSGN
ncbi:unnamed protein product [Urochloa decumbens]|uniref:Jacalin-type lectin domain-containing protein n=1 Tax=Urochloa decumbens TaxID=240449 RepID=A0ABC8VTJ1_9POAL